MRLFVKPGKKLTDEELMLAYRTCGDMDALADLFYRYIHLIFFICNKYLPPDECEDAAMEVFEKLTTGIAQYEVSNFKSWLGTVTKNHCLLKLRREDKVSFERLDEYMEVNNVDFSSDTDIDYTMEVSEMNKWLYRSIDRLEITQRDCIRLFYLESKSYEEIMKSLKITKEQVRSSLQNGKRNLRIMLTRKENHAQLYNA